jgi:hypothetical protein
MFKEGLRKKCSTESEEWPGEVGEDEGFWVTRSVSVSLPYVNSRKNGEPVPGIYLFDNQGEAANSGNI